MHQKLEAANLGLNHEMMGFLLLQCTIYIPPNRGETLNAIYPNLE
jgi:hypothetical protein